MTVVSSGQDVLVPTSDLAQVSLRISQCLASAGVQVVPAGQAVLHVAWRGRPRWAYVLGWLTMPLLGLGALIWLVRRTESSTITMMAERAGVRVHITGVLPDAAMAALQQGFSGVAAPLVTSGIGPTPATPSTPPGGSGIVSAVPGFAPPREPAPLGPPRGMDLAASQTVISPAHRKLGRTAPLSFTLDNGQAVVMAAFGLLGRNPAPDPGDPQAQLVAVPDTTRTVSKTHLAYGVDAGEIWVMDRHSTNGTTIIAADGSRVNCRPGVRATVFPGQTVQFGDRTLVVNAIG